MDPYPIATHVATLASEARNDYARGSIPTAQELTQNAWSCTDYTVNAATSKYLDEVSEPGPYQLTFKERIPGSGAFDSYFQRFKDSYTMRFDYFQEYGNQLLGWSSTDARQALPNYGAHIFAGNLILEGFHQGKKDVLRSQSEGQKSYSKIAEFLEEKNVIENTKTYYDRDHSYSDTPSLTLPESHHKIREHKGKVATNYAHSYTECTPVAAPQPSVPASE